MRDDRIAPSAILEETPDEKPEDRPSKQRHRKIVAGIIAACSVVLIGVSIYFLVPAMGQSSTVGILQTTSDQSRKDANNQDATSSQGKTTSGKESGTDTGGADNASASSASAAGEGIAAATGGSGGRSVSSGSDSSSQPTNPSANSSGQGQTSQDGVITVSVSVSSSAVGNPVSGGTTATFAKGASVYDALMACGLSVNASTGSMGIYVSAIGGLAEFEHGDGSGWKYSVNGADGPVSCSRYILNDGDVVSWRYVLSANG